MFTNRGVNGNNHIGKIVAAKRKALKLSQREVADLLTTSGVVLDKNAVQRIESGQRFVTDVELVGFCKVFGVELTELYPPNIFQKDQ